MNWLDIKYINLLSGRLEHFKRKGETLFNFRCPICGDSDKNSFKARGYIYGKNGKMFYRCHNCGAGMTAKNFIRIVDGELYKQYVQEGFSESGHRRPTFKPDIGKFTTPKFKKKGPLSKLKTVSQLAYDHPVKQYVVDRMIPNKFHGELFYAPKFFTFCNTVIPDKFPDVKKDHPRLIIPFLDQYKNVFGFQGRSFGKVDPKYLTIMIDDRPKIYGLDRVDFSKKNYILEGPIDSMFLDNAVAMAGSDIGDHFDFSNSVFIFDNEPRSEIIVKKMEKKIAMGNNVFIWPSEVKQKDINDCVLEGLEIQSIIDKHTFSGLSAQMALTEWKRV